MKVDMQRTVHLTVFSLVMFAVAAQALPPIVFYNYSAPQPSFVLVSVTPRDHQEFSAPPPQVAVSFSEAVDATQSSVAVYDQYNTPLVTAATNPKENALSLQLPKKLFSGTYRIEWKATCGCKEHNSISGTSHFTID